MFVVHYDNGRPVGDPKRVSGYVRKRDGMNDFLSDPSRASTYPTADWARGSGLVGHHRDMGGDGFRGRVVSLETARRDYAAQQRRRSHW